MNITVYTSFAKRKNSTKQPTGGTAVSSVELKKPTSLHDPTFVLGKITGVTMENITYVKAFGHYFYVTDITVTPHNYYEIACSEDPMASNKTGILASKQYVMYSASLNNDMIPDNRIHIFPSLTPFEYQGSTDFLDKTGYFVIGLIDSWAASDGFVNYYITDAATIAELAYFVNIKLIDLLTTEDPNSDILKSTMSKLAAILSSAGDYVVSLNYIPFNYADITGEFNLSTQFMYIGPTIARDANNAGITAYHFKDLTTPATNADGHVYFFDDKIQVPDVFSQDFRIASPYTKMRLFIPGYGSVSVDPIQCSHGVMVRCRLDVITGDVLVKLYGYPETYDSNPVLLQTFNYNIAIPIPIAASTSSGGSFISAITSAVASASMAAAKGSIVGSLMDAVNSANNIAASSQPGVSVKGSVAGWSFTLDRRIELTIEKAYTQDLDVLNDTQGRPLMQEVTLSNLSGFCQCSGASVELNCMESDRDFINGCLNSGFFIE